MKMNRQTLVATLGGLLLTALTVPSASAACGSVRPATFLPNSFDTQAGAPQPLRVNDYVAPIVGLWHVKFFSEGSAGIPDGAEVDAGYSQWHSDGTEILNSGSRPPLESNFCLGVWKQVGEFKYRLNHFAIGWDTTGTHLIGRGRIQEYVTIQPDGNHFEGYFTIDQYDEANNVLGHVQGKISGVRINVDSTESSIF